MNLNQQFIDGSWYEEEYRDKWYRHLYIEKPEEKWAKESNEYYIGLKILYTGLKPDQSILDLGSSTGRYMKAWKRLGYKNIKGIEISKTAFENAENDCEVCHGTAENMRMFNDKEFNLVESAAFFEHIDESIINKTIRECFRVGKMQAHTIGLDKGTDPSHINIKTLDEWMIYFEKNADSDKYLISCLPDPLFNNCPVLTVIHEDDLKYPLLIAMKNNEEK